MIDGEVAGAGFNQPIASHDPRRTPRSWPSVRQPRRVGNYRLTGATLYVTVEPCLMCVGAMVHARIATVVFGAPEPKAGAMSRTLRGARTRPALNHRIRPSCRRARDECREIIQAFFRERRGQQAASRGLRHGAESA